MQLQAPSPARRMASTAKGSVSGQGRRMLGGVMRPAAAAVARRLASSRSRAVIMWVGLKRRRRSRWVRGCCFAAPDSLHCRILVHDRVTLSAEAASSCQTDSSAEAMEAAADGPAEEASAEPGRVAVMPRTAPLPEPEPAAASTDAAAPQQQQAQKTAVPAPAPNFRLVCELCAAKKRELEDTATPATASNKRRKPKEFANVGRLSSHVKAAHPDCHVSAALAAEDLAQHRPVTVYEDAAMVVCVKPAGIDTRDFGHIDGMVLLALAEGLTTPQTVHRLDAATAGCLAMARTKDAVVSLNASFEQRLVKKRYAAIVCGDFPRELGESGVLDTPLGGKPCVTHFTVVRRDPSVSHGAVTTLLLEPHTGRTHQLRRHMEGCGCPIAGDTAYQPWLSLKTSGAAPPPLLLWAARLTLPHP